MGEAWGAGEAWGREEGAGPGLVGRRELTFLEGGEIKHLLKQVLGTLLRAKC